MSDEVLELNKRRKKEIQRYLNGTFDPELLVQCAYYPRPPAFGKQSSCIQCKFESPNPVCPYGHILLDTRLVYIYEWITQSKYEPNEEGGDEE